MKKFLIFIVIFIVGCQYRYEVGNEIKYDSEREILQDSYKTYGYRYLDELTDILKNEDKLSSLHHIKVNVLDYENKGNSSDSIMMNSFYSSFSIYGGATKTGNRITEPTIKENLTDYLKEINLNYIGENYDLENAIINMLYDERTLNMDKEEMEKFLFEQGLVAYIYEKTFNDMTKIRVYNITLNYNINYLEAINFNFIQTFNDDGIISAQSITTRSPVKIRDIFLINGDVNRLILFVSNTEKLNDIRAELYFYTFVKDEYEPYYDKKFSYWDNQPIKIKETIYTANMDNFIPDFSLEPIYSYDGVSIPLVNYLMHDINYYGIFDLLYELEENKSFFITIGNILINYYDTPIFIKYEILE